MFWLLIRGAKPPALDAAGRVADPSTQRAFCALFASRIVLRDAFFLHPGRF